MFVSKLKPERQAKLHFVMILLQLKHTSLLFGQHREATVPLTASRIPVQLQKIQLVINLLITLDKLLSDKNTSSKSS
jgi:hypothetical protein